MKLKFYGKYKWILRWNWAKNPLQYANERQFYKYQTVYDRKREVLEQAAPAAATLGNT